MPPTTRTRRDSRREAINERLSVELPVCPTCQHVGRLPIGAFSGKGFCTGPINARHKRVPMQKRTFEAVA